MSSSTLITGLSVVAVLIGLMALAWWTGRPADVAEDQDRRGMSDRNFRLRTSPTEPGWYHDPEGIHSHQAYWDGEKWTGDTRPPPRDGLSPALTVVLVLAVVVIIFLFMVLRAGIGMLPG